MANTQTLQQAAQSALDVQDACNAAGIIHSLDTIVREVLIPLNIGTREVNSHPIVAMYLYKLGELSSYGVACTLDAGYEMAESACKALAEVSR